MCRAGGVTMLGRHATETRAAHSMLALSTTPRLETGPQSGTGRSKGVKTRRDTTQAKQGKSKSKNKNRGRIPRVSYNHVERQFRAAPAAPAAPACRACRALPLTALAKQGARCAQMPPRRRYQPGGGGATCASTKARIMLRRLRFGMTVLLSSVAPVTGEVSLVRSHSDMAVRS
eukprot:scaffold36062_cov49-Phaeocystis_antarctica.AAC.1